MSKIHSNEPAVNMREFDSNSVSNLPLTIVSNGITHKYLEENHPLEKFKSDNVILSTKNYLYKYYKPSPDCMIRPSYSF